MADDEKEVKCANCGKLFKASSYELLSDFIIQVKPACSRECRVALDKKKKGSKS